jgi:Fe-S cluster assembly protein SufD
MVTYKDTVDWYLSAFEGFENGLNGQTGSELHRVRRRAIERFVEIGFPTTREEEWRFTNVAPIAEQQFTPVLTLSDDSIGHSVIEPFTLAGLKCVRLVFINGHFSKRLSSLSAAPKGLKVGSLAGAIRTDPDLIGRHLAHYADYTDNAFAALNTAFMLDGAFVYVRGGKDVELPIHLIFISSDHDNRFVSHPRNLVIAEESARVSIVESYVGLAANEYLTNAVTEIVLGEKAVVEHDQLQIEGPSGYHIGTLHVVQQRKSIFTSNSISLGGALVRNNVKTVLAAEDSECTLNGLSLATSEQLIDNHTTIDHTKPGCRSHELYKAVLDGKSRGVFNGRIYVRKGAQKTDAKQTNKTLLLSPDATMDSKPQLEIFADDVKCTHGAAIGQLDEEQVFYLRSRGLGEDEARDILTYAFASDIINRIHVEALRKELDRVLLKRLQEGRLKARE